MSDIVDEIPQLFISVCLIVTIAVLLALKTIATSEGLPVITLVAAYWLGNGMQRLAVNHAMVRSQQAQSPQSTAPTM